MLTVPTLGLTGAPASTGATERMETSRARVERVGANAGVVLRKGAENALIGAAFTAWAARLLLATDEV
jgi:hypothetical protein